MSSWLEKRAAELAAVGEAAEKKIEQGVKKISAAGAAVTDYVEGKKRFVAQAANHTMDDRICTFVSKSNPDDKQAYRVCVDTLSYNRYARKCSEVMKSKLSDKEKERKCIKYKWEYLMETLPMQKIPKRIPEPALWATISDQEAWRYNSETHNVDETNKYTDEYEVEEESSTERGSSRRRGSARGRRGSCKKVLRGSCKKVRRGSCRK